MNHPTPERLATLKRKKSLRHFISSLELPFEPSDDSDTEVMDEIEDTAAHVIDMKVDKADSSPV